MSHIVTDYLDISLSCDFVGLFGKLEVRVVQVVYTACWYFRWWV